MANNVEDILKNPFSKRSYEMKLKIIKIGKPRPPLENLLMKHKDKKCEYTRRFSFSTYDRTVWLTGCEVRAKLFCWPCLLFSKESSVWNRSGFGDLNHLVTAMKKHERAQSHIQSFFSFKMFGKQQIEVLIDDLHKSNIMVHNELVNKNREVLKRIIDAVIYLGKQEQPFQSHSESANLLNKGNYIEFLNVLREYDSVLDTHLNTTKEFHCTSPSIQNYIIEAIADVIKDHIKKEVNSANFVAIILDETSDIMTKSQLSTVLRFVYEGVVHERFIGFTDVSSDKTADGLFCHIVNVVEEFQIQEKLVGQTCDEASVMSGHINSLQAKVLEAYPLAMFTHCYDRVLNFVLQQGLSNMKECKPFFQMLNGLSDFFFKSHKNHALQEFITSRLPTVASMRCNYTSRLSELVKEHRNEFIDFFKDILKKCELWDPDTVIKARGFLSFLEDSLSIKLLHIFSKIFEITEVLYKNLQSKSLDVLYCSKKITDILQQLRYEQHNSCVKLWDSYESEENIPKFLRYDSITEEKLEFYQLFNTIVDSICEQIETRFCSVSNLEYFHLLANENYSQYKERFPDELINKLKTFYGVLFDYIRLKNELTVIYSCPEFSDKPVHELIQFVKKNNLESGFQEVYKLGQLILTLPISAAPTEHSVSIYNRISTCNRCIQGQDRLSGLSLISTEKGILMELKKDIKFYESVIEKFLLKESRIKLIYK